MDFSSRDYDKIRVGPRRSRARASANPSGPEAVATHTCDFPGCSELADYKAPKGRGKEGQYYRFCLDHVREYNKGYNYFDGMKDDEVIAYQRDAITGHRPTSPIGVRGAPRARAKAAWQAVYDDPFGLFGEMGDGAPQPERERRRPKGPERDALEVMGLAENASKEAIKSRYKTLVKRHHPDANQGDRSSEERLRSVINAYAVLRRAGYC